MLNPKLLQFIHDNHISRYSLVTATAKRAREIYEEAEKNKEILLEKPVSMAVDEIVDGKYVIVEPDEIKNEK